MKIRTDFVTNSSSSNFILAFKTQDEFNRFISDGEEYNYECFTDLIKNIMNEKDGKAFRKDIALEWLYRYYRFEKVGGYELEKEIADERRKNIWDINFELDEEYQKEIATRIKKTDFERVKQRILDSEIIVRGEIWDGNGGLLEWAIRHGFIQDCFRRYCIMVWNIG